MGYVYHRSVRSSKDLPVRHRIGESLAANAHRVDAVGGPDTMKPTLYAPLGALRMKGAGQTSRTLSACVTLPQHL